MMMAAAQSTQVKTPDTSTLDRLLCRFSTSAQQLAAEYEKLPDSPDSRLRNLLAEIDETVLSRCVTLRAADKTVARLTISNRRLVAIDMSDKATPQAQSQSIADHFAECLVAIAMISAPLSVTADRRPAQSDSLESTCSVSALKSALGQDAGQSAFEQFAQVIAPQAIARVSWSASAAHPDFSGKPDWQDLLEAYAREFRNRGKGGRSGTHFEPDETEGVVIPLSPDLALVIAGVADQGIAAVLSQTAGFEAIAAWQIAAALGND